MPSDLKNQLQSLLGEQYTIERELAAGGMGRLFLATELALKRPVVIKVLPHELTSELSAARFQREIELAAQLRHPHILPVHAAGSRGGLLYYVMPFVPGESLRRRMERESAARGTGLPIAEALRLVQEVCDALAYAHRSGVVHRDIKPENILLEHGHAVLADFGIARALAAGTSGDHLTQTGMSIGTPGYMAPEQAAGDSHVDARADVYSLAVVAYEMLANARPFTGAGHLAILTAQLRGSPAPLATVRPDTPASVSQAIHKALAAAPEQRFATAAEFQEALLEPTVVTSQSARSLTSELRGTANTGRMASILGVARRFFRRHADGPTTSVSASTVAVFPFTVLGSDKLRYLSEGLVDLLSTRLEGAAAFSVADPRAVLGEVTQEGRRDVAPETGRRISDRVGAGMFVLGSLLEIGGRLQLTASLYDNVGRVRTTAQATGDETRIFELVDELAIQLVAGQEREAPRLVQLAATTTHSLTALKSYLNGEQHFRVGEYSLARDCFKSATAADPSFALAWYRLSVASEWSSDGQLADEAAEKARQHGERLSEHDRALLDAFLAWRHGDPSAEEKYRTILGNYPNDVEAWFQLGEVLFHAGPLSGRSIVESREAWERVVFFEPGNLAALYHLGRIASLEGRRGELEDLTRRVLALSPEGERALEMRSLRAFAVGDVTDQQHVTADLRHAPDSTLNFIFRAVAMYGGDLDGAIALARFATGTSHSEDFKALAHVQLAHLLLARGKWRDAKVEIVAAEGFRTGFATEARGLLATMPFLPVSRSEVNDTREALIRWDAATVPRSDSNNLFLKIHNDLHCHVRLYVLGLLSVRLGDHAAAHRYATELQAQSGGAAESMFVRVLAAAVHAHVAAERGETATALASLEESRPDWGHQGPLASPFYSQCSERFLRARLLAASGRELEALRLYNSFAEVSVYDVAFLAPSHLERARIHERLGDHQSAKDHYSRFIDLWAGCDGVLSPQVAEAESRLVGLA